MNFVREIIEIVNENETVDARKNLTKILTEIKRYQNKTKLYIDTNYTEFLSSLNSNEIYIEEGERLIREVEDLLERIENETKHDLYSATDELRQYIEELQESTIGIRISYKIIKIDELFHSLELAKSNSDYLNVMENIGQIKTLIDDRSDNIFSKLDCYQNIKIKYHIESEMLLHNLKQCFEQLIQLNVKPFQNTKSIEIKITKDEKQLNDIVLALFNVKYNPKKLCDFLLENIFEPITIKPCSLEFNENSNPEYIQLLLSFNIKTIDDQNLRPNYKIVIKNYIKIFQCLNYMNVKISENMNVLKIFGENMKEKFQNLLINECFKYSIPDTMDEMNESTLVQDIQQFHKYLINIDFLDGENDLEFSNYAEKIGILFRNRFCTNILDNAIIIIRKDLHDMSVIAENINDIDLTKNSFSFPRCMISKSTLELINLMEKVLRQAQTSDENIAQRLISTIPLILERYLTECPTYHEKFLHNIPQQTALFHNNCMFLAHWVTKNADSGIESCSTILKKLQNLGSEHFLKQIKNQRSQLLEILQEFDLSDSVSELSIGPQKIVRQCLRQLDLLKNVWQTILPDIIYNKTMSNLLNDFCNEIIKRILNMEDISTSIANELCEICSTIMERAPTIFQDPLQVHNVKLWMKLNQLKMILGASLIQITEQWSEGKGPLTLNYTAEEVKHLIRALFQNTDRRANALSSII